MSPDKQSPKSSSGVGASAPARQVHSRPKLFLVDGNSFIYRAFYAIRALSNSKGEPTNAIYGFITMLKKLLAETEPKYAAICFDRPEPTFRHTKFENYKAHRKPMPEDLVPQIEPIKEFCRLSHFQVFEKPGFEADDLIGTLAAAGEKRGLDVYIVTGDKDMMQLVDEHIKILNPHKENWIGDIARVKERFDGLGPEKVVEVMAIMGDASDNIPGVPGIGEKGALKLIHQFGSVENLIKHVEKVSSKSQKNLIKDNLELLKTSRELAKIDTQVPVDADWDAMALGNGNEEALTEFYKRYEFRHFLKGMPEPAAVKAEEEKGRKYHLVSSEKQLEALAERLNRAGAFSLDTETTSEDPMRAELVGISVAVNPLEAFYVPVSSARHSGSGIEIEKVLKALGPALESEKHKKYGQNIKYDWIVLKRAGVTVRGYEFDTMIASYLVNPIKLNHNLDDISLDYLNVRKITTASLLGSGKNQKTMDQLPAEEVSSYACEDADCVLRLVSILRPRLKENGLEDLFRNVEMPLALVLGQMEMNGVALDTELLAELSLEVGKNLEKLTREIYKEAGEEFNINSPKQLAEILFVKMKMPAVKKTKTGFSTDVSVLEKLAVKYSLPKHLLEFREKSKLKSTYLDALPQIINPATGLVHTSYHQTTTATGRLSSSDPNLQNIPIRAAEGRMIRKAFVPRSGDGRQEPGDKGRETRAGRGEKGEGGDGLFSVIPAEAGIHGSSRKAEGARLKPGTIARKILSADYSQIELRILAHLTGDKNLTEAFREDRDIHKFTATLLYGVKEADVTREMRDMAKTINFSVIYGKTAYGLSQELGISVSEADGFIKNYFERYKSVKEYLDSQKELARKQGYLTTILGRRSYFPDINSKNVPMRQFAERAAINAPIQGSAADLIKLAMIDIEKTIEEKHPDCLMIMQVHDELVFDAPAAEMDSLSHLVKKRMEGAYKMRVPLKVDLFVGESWYK